MSPDFVSLPSTSTVSEALGAIRGSTAPHEAIHVVFVNDAEGGVIGSASAVRLIQADPTASLESVMVSDPPHVHADWDLGATVRKMSDFNLTVALVMDADHSKILGVVTVDDVLELLLPSGWRRDFGTAAPES
jgi:Mg/Co/Ni transporter MgtE